MRRAGWAAALWVALSASPAAAVTPRDVTITNHSVPGSGTFVATGAIADFGDVIRDDAKFTAVGSPTVGTGQFTYTFVGRAGTFTVRLQWLLTATDDPTLGHIDGRWNLAGGTGAYAGLRGEGDYIATIDFIQMFRDAVFTGQLH